MGREARALRRTYPSRVWAPSLAPAFERPHPYLLRDSNFLLPRIGSNSFDAEGVRVSFYMSRFGEPQNPRWGALDGQRCYGLVIDEIGQ